MVNFLLKIDVNNFWQKLLNNHLKKTIFWIKLILFSTIFFSFFIQCKVFLDPDLGWHLREGQRIYEGGEVYSPDEYTFTMAGYKWNNHEWLVQVSLWLLKSNNLWFLAEIIFALLASLPLLFWIIKTKHYEELIFIYLGSILLGDFVGVRPQMITFFLFSLTLIILLWRFSNKLKEKYFPYYSAFFVLLFWLWANTHGGFFAALILFSIFIFSNIVESWFKNRKIFYKYFWIDFLTIFLAFVFTFINPIGWLVYKEIFDVMVSSIPPDFINEWQPFLDRLILSSPFFESLFKLFFVIFSTVCLIFSWKKIPLYLKLTFIFFLIMFLRTVRMGPLFMITAIPVIFLFLNDFRTILIEAKREYLISSKKWRVVLWSLVLMMLVSFYFYSNSNFFKNYEDDYFPKEAVVYLKNEVKEGENIKLFNNYNWGGYLIYHIPEIKVFVDGRGPHWVSDTGYSTMEDYLKVIRGEMGWKLIFDRYNINTLLIGSSYENDNDDKKEKSFVSVLKSFFMKMKIYFYGNDDEKDSLSLYENIKKSGQWEIIFKDDVATVWRLKK